MRAVLLRSLAVVAAGGLVLAGVLYVASTVDTRPPTVLGIRLTTPAGDDDRLAVITTSLEITFNEPVAADSASNAVHLEPDVPGAISWSGSTMIFTPSDPLELESDYRLVVDEGIRDPAGNEMTDVPAPFEFRTLGRPALASSVPADGEDGVATDAPIALTFSTLMDTVSVENALRLSPGFSHELRWSGQLLEIVPQTPLHAGAEYELTITGEAADVAGVTIDEPITVSFRTTEPGLEARTIVPANGVAGIAPTSPIAVIFDRPIDPESVTDELLAITPEVAGTLEVLPMPDDEPTDDGAGRLLRFTPSAPLPSNTTFEVELVDSPTSAGGGTLPGPLRWSFTTGSPPSAISNGITFLSDRAGVPNVWLMNPDGTGQRQLTAEITAVLDYSVAPDGSSLVVGDGRQLVYQRADGSDRRVLTGDGTVEFDPAYAPDGQRVAFARVDAASGEPLGLWEWTVDGGDPVRIELPAAEEPQASAGQDDDGPALRAPRYSPDGEAIAFIEAGRSVGILDLETGELSSVEFAASAAPLWLPDSRGVLITGLDGVGEDPGRVSVPVLPLQLGDGDVHRIGRTALRPLPLELGEGARVLASTADGLLAVVDGSGFLRIVDGVTDAPTGEPLVDGPIAAAAFDPGGDSLVVALEGDDGGTGALELLDRITGERTELAADGAAPRWVP